MLIPEKNDQKKFIGLTNSLWTGLMISSLTCFILHSTAGFLMLGFFTKPIGLYVYIPDALIIIPLFILAIIGMKKTKSEQRPDS